MRTTAKLLALGSLVAVTLLWWSGRATSAPGIAAGGRLAALLSTDLLLLQVLLMARIPWVERAFGQDRLGRWHRWTGGASFVLLLAHAALATAAAREKLLAYRGVWPAVAGFAALVLVVVTSVRWARRLRYETWHLLHLYAYAGIALAVPHELWLGSDFTAPLAQPFWWAMYTAATGCTLVFRLGLPIWRTLRHRLRVDRVVDEAPGLVSVYLRGRRLDRLPARAGQYFVWRFLDGGDALLGKPFSLSGPPRADSLRITVKTVGEGTARVAALRPGTRVLIEGPYGRMTNDTYSGGPITMFACGIGVTPAAGAAVGPALRPRQGDTGVPHPPPPRRHLPAGAGVAGPRPRRPPGPAGGPPRGGRLLAAGRLRRLRRPGRPALLGPGPGRPRRVRLRPRPVDRRRPARGAARGRPGTQAAPRALRLVSALRARAAACLGPDRSRAAVIPGGWRMLAVWTPPSGNALSNCTPTVSRSTRRNPNAC
ncbi:hypothetical protein GCM10020218_024900 [Dactylosporangium vinaceum]